jgi:hypothetical protein
MRGFLAFVFLARLALAGSALDLARAIRENTFDNDECYRVRDLTLAQDDLRLYFTDGHLIFGKPVAGKRIVALFTADTDGGDAEVMLLPPDRAERRSLAGYIDSPNLDEHFETALLLFTGDEYEKIKAQFTADSSNRKSPESAPLLEERWTPVMRSLAASYQTRLTLDLLGGAARPAGLLLAALSSSRRGPFEVVFDPERQEQIVAGQFVPRGEILYFDTWTSFQSRSFRNNPVPLKPFATVADYRIDAAIGADLVLTAVTHVKVKPGVDGLAAVPFDLTPEMQVALATVDGRPAEVLQDAAPQANVMRGGNELIVVVPPEPLRLGREYDFEFHHSGKVIQDSGDRVLYVSARADWYPAVGDQFAAYDLSFRYPRDLDLVTAGDVVEDRVDGAQRITRRRTSAPIRVAGFNLGNYEHARVARGGYEVDVCANRALEPALQPKAQPLVDMQALGIVTHGQPDPLAALARSSQASGPGPLDRLHEMASEVASALEFMASKFGPPALPHITVSPIPGAFGQGFPGLIYLSTLSYLKTLPNERQTSDQTGLVLRTVLQSHELAHQWWGNRVSVGSDRDTWLMEALANYSALLYVEKSKGRQALETMLDSYRRALLEKGENGQTVESSGPIVLGSRLKNSVEPRGWHDIVYGKGSWIMQMLRARMGDQAFFSMLAEMVRRYDRKTVTTEQFRELAAGFLPPKSDDPHLELFFDQWVYGTGMPSLTMTYALKGKAPALKLTGTVTQSGVDEGFSAAVPIEIQLTRDHAITHWVSTGNGDATFTVALKQPPLKVTLDPHYAVLRK